MIIGLLVAFVLISFLANIAARAVFERARAQRCRREREEALAVSLKLDVSREARTLKRAEVREPAARILCVDDEEIVLDSFRKILVLDGYSVDTVQTGQEALGLIQTRQYDFVFTDLRMPAMDGVEVVKAVKHMRPDVDVIIITGFATVETAVECMKHGAMDYVQKPFTEAELCAFVRKAVIVRQDRIDRQLKPRVHITNRTQPGKVGADEFTIPGGVLISRGHCWVSLSPDGVATVGMDDFARKLVGRVDALELPKVGATLKAGEPLFAIRQKARKIQFLSPISGRVTTVNEGLSERPSEPDGTPCYEQWVSTLEAGNLNAEIAGLRIGRSAEALFHEDIGRVTAMLGEISRAKPPGTNPPGTLCVGALEALSDGQWDQAARELFGRPA